jgi:hypothetical protein
VRESEIRGVVLDTELAEDASALPDLDLPRPRAGDFGA